MAKTSYKWFIYFNNVKCIPFWNFYTIFDFHFFSLLLQYNFVLCSMFHYTCKLNIYLLETLWISAHCVIIHGVIEKYKNSLSKKNTAIMFLFEFWIFVFFFTRAVKKFNVKGGVMGVRRHLLQPKPSII